MTDPKITLLQILPVGRNNARTGRDLARELIERGVIERTHRDAPRVVRQWVHEIRAAGVPVCADANDGFYLPRDRDELREYLTRLGRRLKELVEPYNALRATYKDWSAYIAGQTSAEPDAEPLSHIPEPLRSEYLGRVGIARQQQAAQLAPQRQSSAGNFAKPDIPYLMRRALEKYHGDPAKAGEWVQMQLMTVLRRPPFCIALPLSYLNREGWTRNKIAEYIAPLLESRLRDIQSQQTLIEEDTNEA